MCLCTHINALRMGLHMRVCEHLCGFKKMTWVIVRQCYPPWILNQGLSLAWSLTSSLGWLANEPQGFACPCFPSTGIASILRDA